jgi:hypothetical protein
MLCFIPLCIPSHILFLMLVVHAGFILVRFVIVAHIHPSSFILHPSSFIISSSLLLSSSPLHLSSSHSYSFSVSLTELRPTSRERHRVRRRVVPPVQVRAGSREHPAQRVDVEFRLGVDTIVVGTFEGAFVTLEQEWICSGHIHSSGYGYALRQHEHISSMRASASGRWGSRLSSSFISSCRCRCRCRCWRRLSLPTRPPIPKRTFVHSAPSGF